MELSYSMATREWGYGIFTARRLKITQEAVTLAVFMAFACLMAAVFFAFLPQIERAL